MDFLGLSPPLLTGVAISAVGALAFYIAFAAGQFNVAQAGFISIGAYSVAMATTSGHSIFLGLVVGLAISAAFGCALSALTRKLSGVYLAMATLAFVQVVEQTIYVTPALHGPLGIYGIPLALNAWQCWAILAVIALVVARVMKSRIGYEMRILREDPVAARGIGVNEFKVRLFAGIASAMIAAIAGAMKALTTSYISPEEFSFGLLIQIMSFAIIGGTDRFWGPILGAIVLVLLPEYTRALQEYRMVFTGAIIILVVVLFPEGIAGALMRLARILRRKYQPAGATATKPSVERRGPAKTKVDLASAPLIGQANGVTKRFGGVTAVNEASIELRQGIVHGLIGPNGAGKSTLVDLVSGEQRLDAGSVTFEGTDISTLSAFERARRGITRTFQHSRVTQNITAHEVAYSGCLMASRPSSLGYVLCIPSVLKDYRQHHEKAQGYLARLGLESVKDEFVRDLGWEQQRRLEMVRAIALESKVLLLDEPTAGMHASALPELSGLIRDIAADGVVVVLIEHNVAFIRASVDVLYAMDSGRMIAHGLPDEVLAEPAVIDSYLGVRTR